MNTSLPARANEALIDELYERWVTDHSSVDPEWAAFFEGFELGMVRSRKAEVREAVQGSSSPLQARVDLLVEAYRTIGHTAAHLNPLSKSAPSISRLEPSEFGLGEADLSEVVSSRNFQQGRAMPLKEMIAGLRQTYCETLGVEFTHIQDPAMSEWVANRVENRRSASRQLPEVHRDILRKLYQAETFESFIHTKFVGQKRFSLEGGESLMLSLDAILEGCGSAGVMEIVMGMAHRGRLNVLANFLKKPLDVIFNEFQDTFDPQLVGGSGDVKYHLGSSGHHVSPTGASIKIELAANPSHLETVDPLVLGMVRARQDQIDPPGSFPALPILIGSAIRERSSGCSALRWAAGIVGLPRMYMAALRKNGDYLVPVFL